MKNFEQIIQFERVREGGGSELKCITVILLHFSVKKHLFRNYVNIVYIAVTEVTNCVLFVTFSI